MAAAPVEIAWQRLAFARPAQEKTRRAARLGQSRHIVGNPPGARFVRLHRALLRRSRPSSDTQAIVEQAERIVTEQAGIPTDPGSLYARFHDLHLVDVCHGIIDGTISLLHCASGTADRLRRTHPSSPTMSAPGR